MKCMIVEDEKPAVTVLKSHISAFQDLEIVEVHHTAMDALISLQKNKIDILFLDLNLPRMNGMDLLNTLTDPPAVIMTTAHREYALESYQFDVTDYLLKPISFDRFAKSIAKVYKQKSLLQPVQIMQNLQPEISLAPSCIYVKVDREFVKIVLRDILYVESIKNHVRIVTSTHSYITLSSLKAIEDRLPNNQFVRIHRSYIISLSRFDKFSMTNVIINDKTLPIGGFYKQSFLSKVNGQITE